MLASVLLFLCVLQVYGRTIPPPPTSSEDRGCEPGANGCRTSTTETPETRGPGCDVDGVWFAPGQHYDANDTCWRGGILCFENGHYQYNWEDRCSGCDYSGKWYPPGDIYRGQYENWCYGLMCFDDGTLILWDDFYCVPTTPYPTQPPVTRPQTTPPTTPYLTQPPITRSPTTPPTTRSIGCMYNGRPYSPGNYKTGQTGNWCYGIICEYDGTVLAWDDWECGSTATRTTVPRTTRPTTRPIGCVHNGRRYSPGSYKTGQTGNWCYGIICGPDGTMTPWDDWECGNITETTSTTSQQTRPIPFTRTTAVDSASRRSAMEAIRTIVRSIVLFFIDKFSTLNFNTLEFRT